MTICALATAPGGALGIIRLSGPDALSIVDQLFRGKHPLADAKPYTLHYGDILSSDGELLDSVLVSIFRAPHSYTGENSAELSCHASPYILQRIVEELLANGCRMAQPGEFTQRAFLNGKLDLAQAAAVADLIAAENATTHRLALQQMRGGYSTQLKTLREQLVTLTALLELELDFSEEDVTFADRQQLSTLATDIAKEIARLASTFQRGNALKRGIPVAIIGAPNVGKSTLLNALLRDDRAIVSDQQGTTRDLIEDTITLDGITFRFIDTAGLRHTTDQIEQMGIDRSLQAAQRAQIIIMLTEPGVPFPTIPLRDDQTVIKLTNKTADFSALNNIGLEQLEQQLIALADPHDSSDLIVTNLRHYEALNAAHKEIQAARELINNETAKGLSNDETVTEGYYSSPTLLIAEHLRQCIAHLGDIYGETITLDKDILATIFSSFCIGK